MITTVILYIVSFLLSIISGLCNMIAKDFSVWPSNILDGLTYFFTNLMNIDFFLNISAMLTSMKWLVGFLVIYVSIKLALRIMNWVRGSGELDV